MRYIIEYFRRFRKLVGRKIYYLLVFVLISGSIEGVGIVLFLPILQNGFGNDNISKILKSIFGFLHLSFSFGLLLFLILAFFILRAAVLIGYAHYLGRVLANLTIKLRQRILDKIFKVDYLYVLKKEKGYINNIITREIAQAINAFKSFSGILQYTVYAAIYIALSLLLNWKATIFAILFSPIIFGLMEKKINVPIGQVSRQRTFTRGKFHSIVIQCLSNIKYLKATLSNTKISKIIERDNKDLGELRYKIFLLQSWGKNLFELIMVIAVVGLLCYYVVILGRGINEVIFLVFLFMQAVRQFINIQSSYRRFLASRGSIEVLNKFQKELEENKEDLNLDGVSTDFNRDVTLKDVTVIFPNNKRALDNVNINIKPKRVIALVGESGSGKSTIANMITGLIKPTGGDIFFGGVSFDKLNLKSLRENIGYITQEDVIFNSSIRENILLWDENGDEVKLARVIEMAHMAGFVNDLPERQNSALGDNGLDISGGQRQRITLARELYKDTKLLILDEATSSLDSKSENQIYENLKEFKGKKTMVVIAHRLSTIRNVDYIYVLDEGKVVEEGTYEALYQKRGEFKKMIEEQKLV